MKTLVLEEPGTLVWRDVARPIPAKDEAVVRVRRCGVCGTDIHALAGKQPFFSFPRRLGHELCVEVISAPSGSDLRAGDLCAVEAYYFCGSCAACRSGKTNCCVALKVLGVHLDGGHTPLMAVRADKLHRAKQLSPEQLALVEPLVIGAHGVERAALKKNEPTVIIGMGPIGLSAAVFARAAGANVVCVDVRADRLAFASEKMGFPEAMLADVNLASRLQKHFGQLPAVVIDATGNPASMKGGFQLAEHGGRIVFLGLFVGDVVFDDPNFHRRELSIHASRAGLTETFRYVIRLLEAKQVNALPLITHRYEFGEMAGVLPKIHHEAGLVKAMINYDSFEAQ